MSHIDSKVSSHQPYWCVSLEEVRIINNEDMALNESDVNTIDESPALEQTTEEVAEQEAEVESTETAETESEVTETDGSSKKGANQRIRELANKAKQAELEKEALASRLAELTGSDEPIGVMPQQYQPQVEPGTEISPEQYQADIMRAADSLVSIRIKQQDAINRINREAEQSIKAFPQLDPTSENFDKELSDTIAEATEAYVKQNPYSASVYKFVEKLMKPYNRAVENGVSQVTENVAKQVSEAALRPTQVRQTEKSLQDMTPEELEQKLGIVQA